jgi:hypothetical protein
MTIWCCRFTSQLEKARPDVIVFPEGVRQGEHDRARAWFPDAIVVGAIKEGRHMRGVIRHCGENQIDYLKVGADGHTEGAPPPASVPVYDTGEVAVGLLICMDVQNPMLANAVAEQLRNAAAPRKVLCIPAEMVGGSWFTDPLIGPPSWAGLQVALSNNDVRYPNNRLRSFITGRARSKIAEQADREAIHADWEAAG